jgi:acyl-CoA hydrolase
MPGQTNGAKKRKQTNGQMSNKERKLTGCLLLFIATDAKEDKPRPVPRTQCESTPKQLEQTQSTEHHWLRHVIKLAHCGSLKLAPTEQQQP